MNVKTALFDQSMQRLGKGVGRGVAHVWLRLARARDVRERYRRAFLEGLVTLR